MTEQSDKHRLSRRQMLLAAGSATLTATSAGCIRRARSIISRDPTDQISLTITCVPAEEDTFPVEIVSYFRENLDAAGIETTVNYRSYEEFRLDVLLNHEFDIMVGRLPIYPDPDVLYGLFHSSFVPERGWQNPYGFASVELDEQLDMQRTEPNSRRHEQVHEILEILAREQPINPILFPVEHRLVRSDRYDGFEDREFKYSADLLALDPGKRRDELEYTIGFTAPTRNLNPLSVEHRTENIVTGLIYDSLLLRGQDEYHHWLAESADWSARGAVVTLRDALWHDGETVSAQDVDFTYRLLQDTLLDDEQSPAPSPVFRGRTALVDDVVVHDDRTVEFEFAGGRDVARRALTVPILPEHEWRDRSTTAEVSGIENDPQITEATVNSNIPPVGSGPYEFVDRSERDYVDLELVNDHFSTTVDSLSAFEPPATELRVAVAPSGAGAMESVVNGTVDFTMSPLPPEDIDIELSEGTSLTKTESRNLYHVGYNVRRGPLSNASFRRVLSKLIDKPWLASEVFDGEAIPTATPILDTEWVPNSLTWHGSDPEVPFFGDDGTLDLPAVQDAFLEIGYQYDDDGNLRGT